MKNPAVILGVGRGIQMLLLFLSYRLLTMVLPKDEVGQYFFILSLTAITGLLLINPIGTYFNRTLHSFADSKALKRQMIFMVFIVFILALMNFPLLAGLQFVFGTLDENWIFWSLIIFFYVFSTSANNSIIPVFNFFKQRVLFVLLTVAAQGFALLFAYFMSHSSGLASDWLIGHATGFLMIMLVGLIFTVNVEQNDLQKRASMKLLSVKAWQFAWPVAAVNIGVWTFTQGYRPYLEIVSGFELLAEIGFGLGLASALAVAFEYLIQQIYQPDFYQKSHSDPELAWNELAVKSLVHYVSFCIFLLFIGRFIIPLVASGDYQKAGAFLSLGAFIEFFRMLGNLLSMKAHGDLNTSRLRLPYFFATAIFVLGLYVLPYFSIPIGSGLIGALILGYLVLIVFLANYVGVDLRVIYGQYSKHRSRWSLIFILLTIIPHTFATQFWFSASLCILMGVVFLWIQLKLIKKFESHGLVLS